MLQRVNKLGPQVVSRTLKERIVEVTTSYLKKINSGIILELKLILTTKTLFKFFLFSSFSFFNVRVYSSIN
jgi:hypothetical protein